MLRRFVAPTIALLLLVGAVARIAHADAVDDETRRIGKQLQCPVCSGAPVSDSPSELAGQMRTVIRAKLEAGESDSQIIAYFVERYGEGVLVEPPRHGIALIAWLGPIAMLLVGALVLWRLLAGWLRPRWSTAIVGGPLTVAGPLTAHRNGTASAATDDTATTPVDRARAELDRFRREA